MTIQYFLFGTIAFLTGIPGGVMPSMNQDLFEIPMPPDSAYLACTAGVEESPARSKTVALQWISDGGGSPAQHCAAVADLALGLPKLAGMRLMQLADKEALRDPLIGARLYSQAAEALLIANLDDLALRNAKTAYSYGRDDPDLNIVLARAYNKNGQWQETLTLLNALAEIYSLTSTCFVLRATAHHGVGDLESAASDTVAALKLDPLNVDALVLRGTLTQAGLMFN